MNTLYPPAPLNINTQLLEPSADFRKEVKKVVSYIVLFFIVYLLLVAAAVALAVACIYLGGALVLSFGGLLICIVGIGLIALGLAVVFFLVKFVFATTQHNNGSSIEITEADQPGLFEFIRKLTAETQTPFPKKIFLSAGVNASVSYNSSFWSMFLPVRKNLEIGVGLVNALNAGEFKAVMAHEFGHFSQRSMKLGSFTYNVNRIIYNMLFENTGYGNFLRTWGNLHGILSLFALLAAKIAEGIQWVLRRMYSLVNKGYMGLSREMEFHADAIAASVAGIDNVINSLQKLSVADTCFQEVMTRANESLPHKKGSANLFADHRVTLHFAAKECDSFAETPSRVNYKDQWASHPTNEERAARLRQLNWRAEIVSSPAWMIFDDPEKIQVEMTKHLYHLGGVTDPLALYNDQEFEEYYLGEKKAFTVPQKFKSWYSARYPEQSVVQQLAETPPGSLAWSHIINESNENLPAQLRECKRDVAIVEEIASGAIQVKTFDFNGQKYDVSEAASVVASLREEIDRLHRQMQETDLKVMHYLQQQAPGAGHTFIAQSERQTRFNTVAKEVLTLIIPFFSQQELTVEGINAAVEKLKAGPEPACQALWREMLANDEFNGNEPLRQGVEAFLNSYHYYWDGKSFNDNDLNELYNLVVQTDNWIARFVFLAFREWLERVPA